MRVGLNVLRRSIDLPADPREVRQLLDAQGLEVKRVDASANDTVFTLELLANRGDHHCYEGVARELAGRLQAAVRSPAPPALPVGTAPHPIHIASDRCLTYTVTLLERTVDAPLEPDAMDVLVAADIHSLSAPVDATNIANLELGQPTHAFDADTIEGPITIRGSRPGETAHPLFAEQPVELPVDTLVIADESKILAIAGVIGCESSKTTEKTTRLLLESATFDPVAVRKASRALRIFTDSSARFERGADPQRALLGAARVVELLESAGWKRIGPTGQATTATPVPPVVTFSATQASSFLGTTLDADRIAALLAPYGFVTAAEGESLRVQVPSWRLWDVQHPADLYEELAKAIGYDTLPTAAPPPQLGSLMPAADQRRACLDEVFVGAGFFEVFTDGFYGRNVLQLLDLDEGHALWNHTQTTNALDRGYAFLKNNCLHQALLAASTNERRRTTDVAMYEWTRTFHPRANLAPGDRPRTESPCEERPVFWALAAGNDRPGDWSGKQRPADVWFVRGVVEQAARELHHTLEVHALDDDHPFDQLLHPGRRAALSLNGVSAGFLGEIHPAVLQRYKIKKLRPVYLQLDPHLWLARSATPPFVEPASTQDLERHVALALPSGITAAAIMDNLAAHAPPELKHVAPVDLFQQDDGTRSVTFALTFDNGDGTWTADRVNSTTETLVGHVLATYGDRGVEQR